MVGFNYKPNKWAQAGQQIGSSGTSPLSKLISGLATGYQLSDEANQRKEYEDTLRKGIEQGLTSAELEKSVAGQNPQEYMQRLRDREMQEMKNKEAEKLLKFKYMTKAELSPYEKTMQMEQAKADVSASKGLAGAKKMLPSVNEALARAEKSIESGWGLGKIGGNLASLGLVGKEGAENFANVETANSQMNALLRQKLQSSGLTGSELNSALEANAYRYTISPTDSPSIVKKKMANFRTDYMDSIDGVDGGQAQNNDPLGIL